MDFLRKLSLKGGRCLFVEEDKNYNLMTGKMAELVLMSLS